jgi:hypothetical protein
VTKTLGMLVLYTAAGIFLLSLYLPGGRIRREPTPYW